MIILPFVVVSIGALLLADLLQSLLFGISISENNNIDNNHDVICPLDK